MGERKVLDARQFRRNNEVEVTIDDDAFILCRKEDLAVLVFEGRLPMPMLAAVQKMIEMPNASPAERVEALGKENGRVLVEVLREHVCRVALKPKIVMEDDGNEQHLPVTLFDTQTLMRIWTATAVVPQVSQLAAATFREPASAVPADAAPDGHDVPPAAAPVAEGNVDSGNPDVFGLKPPTNIPGLVSQHADVTAADGKPVELISAG